MGEGWRRKRVTTVWSRVLSHREERTAREEKAVATGKADLDAFL